MCLESLRPREVDELTWIAPRHKLVEIAEASRGEAKLFKLDGRNPASVQPVENVFVGCWLERSCSITTLFTDEELARIQPQSGI